MLFAFENAFKLIIVIKIVERMEIAFNALQEL